MSTYRALRGVCVSPGRHLAVGEKTTELDKATAQYLVSIKAVELVVDEPKKDEPPPEPAPEPAPEPKSAPEKSGKSKEK